MASPLALPAPGATRPDGKRLALFCGAVAVVVVYGHFLVTGWLLRDWALMQRQGGLPTDFVAFYVAAKLAAAGEAAAAYDWARHHEAAVAVIGPHGSPHPWLNPPTFLLFLVPFTALGYAYAKAAWLGATLLAYGLAARAVVGHPAALLGALAFPAVFITGISGQNGFLTAALVGGTLALLRPRPWLAGICLGLLTVKPQLGILFPVVLVAAGCWTVILSATVTAALLVATSLVLFGAEPWLAFIHAIPQTTEAILQTGITGWGKMQSLYGVLRHLGAGAPLAWAAQAVFGVLVAAIVVALWRRPLPFEVKAASLAVGALLVQPYVFIYDETILVVPIAFLVRLGLGTAIPAREVGGIALASALLFAIFLGNVHLGFAAALVVALLVLWRAREHGRPALDAGVVAAHNRAGG